LKQGKLLILDRKVNSHRQLRAVRGAIAGLVCGAAMLGALEATADTYRWTDDQGQVIYSQLPPDDGRPYTRIGAPPPPADAEGDKARLEALRQSQADSREDRELSREAQQRDAEQQAVRDKNCAAARNNLGILEAGNNRRIRMPDGSTLRLTAEERQARIDKAKQYIKDNCR
jgi:hypothetical protein